MQLKPAKAAHACNSSNQEEFETSLCFIARPCLKEKSNQTKFYHLQTVLKRNTQQYFSGRILKKIHARYNPRIRNMKIPNLSGPRIQYRK